MSSPASTGLERAPRSSAQVELIVHGTTVTTNAVLTETRREDGAPDDRGLPRHPRDAPRRAQPQAPLRQQVRRAARRSCRATCGCPCASASTCAATSGRRSTRASRARGDRARARQEGVEAIAVCFMHSYAEPAHELRARALVEELAPGLFLAVSSEILPQVRLNDRVGHDGDERVRRAGAPPLRRAADRGARGCRRSPGRCS